MRKISIWIMAILLLCSVVYASDWGYKGENFTLWADVFAQPNYYSASQVNVTIYNTTGDIVINNKAMSLIDTGRYIYTFEPNSTGTYYSTVEYYNTTDKIATASQSFAIHGNLSTQIGDIGMIAGIIIGFIFLICFVLYLSSHMTKKPELKENALYDKFINPKLIGMFLFLVSTWLFVGFVALLAMISQGQEWYNLIEALFILVLILVLAFNILYLSLYVIYKITRGLTDSATRGGNRQ